MKKQKEDRIARGCIVFFFVVYMIGYACLTESYEETTKITERKMMLPQNEIPQTKTEKRQPKSLSAEQPSDSGRHVRSKNIPPGHEQENGEYVDDEASYYQDHYDEYQDDPEDEISFPPEIFDANDD